MYILKLLNSNILTASRNLHCRNSIKKTYAVALFPKMPKKSKTARNFSEDAVVSVNQVTLEVIGNGANTAPPSVMLVTNYGPYMINCGEGTTKLSGEYKIKFHRSQNVFITYPSWRNMSGLLGMALAVQDSKGTEFCVHGHKDIASIFYSIAKLVNFKFLRISIKNCSHYNEFSDGIVNVKYVFLHSSSAEEKNPSESTVSTPVSEAEGLETEQCYTSKMARLFRKSEREKSTNGSKITLDAKESKVEKRSSSPKQEQAKKCMSYAISYIFRTEGSQGSLILEKCLDLGVPPGPLLGQLKNGKDVTLENGTVVRSVDVKTPDLPGVNVIALECPSEDFLDSLLEEPAFRELQSEETPAEAVVHFSSASIIKNPKYQEWLNRFSKKTLHLFINEENKITGSVAIHRQQFKLNLLQPDLFPILSETQIPDYPRTDNTCIQTGHRIVPKTLRDFNCPIYKDKIFIKCESNNFINGETLCTVHLKPKEDFDYTRSIVLKKEEFYKEMFESEEIKEKLEESMQKLKEAEESIKFAKLESRAYPKIVFLGTGSSKPSKVRNGSAILLFVDSSKCMLLDCGEYTFGQLVSFYGMAKAREVLRNLQAIYISHLHLDHHLGLITLLRERKLAFDELNEMPQHESTAEPSSQQSATSFSPIFVLAPIQLSKWLSVYSDKFEDISNLYDIIPNSDMLFNNKRANLKTDVCKKSLGMSKIATVPVVHCSNSFGVSLIHKKGWKITYSGDTRPCKELINMGLDSDILIHEATLGDAYVDEARVKQHSTTGQAIDVGKRMRAKYTLLTHFSQRYCYLPTIDPSFSNLNIGLAFDFMEVPFNKLPLLPALIKPLQYALSKYDELNKTTTQSFLMRKEKESRQSDIKEFFELLGTPAKVSRVKH